MRTVNLAISVQRSQPNSSSVLLGINVGLTQNTLINTHVQLDFITLIQVGIVNLVIQENIVTNVPYLKIRQIVYKDIFVVMVVRTAIR